MNSRKVSLQNRLTKEVQQRLEELGLPPEVTELDGFRENFFLRSWVMLVRDHDDVADVHLIEPPDAESHGSR